MPQEGKPPPPGNRNRGTAPTRPDESRTTIPTKLLKHAAATPRRDRSEKRSARRAPRRPRNVRPDASATVPEHSARTHRQAAARTRSPGSAPQRSARALHGAASIRNWQNLLTPRPKKPKDDGLSLTTTYKYRYDAGTVPIPGLSATEGCEPSGGTWILSPENFIPPIICTIFESRI